MIIATYFHSQNVEKHKEDKIVTPFPKVVSFYHFIVPEEIRISEIFFAILLTKMYRKQVLKKITNNKQGKFLKYSLNYL